MSKETKISNLRKQLEQNRKKEEKLKLINMMIEQQIVQLSKPKEKPSVPTEEQRESQSAKDKREWTAKLQKLKQELS